ncbi:MAG: hypothetical protein JWN86_2999 [Planctomycetota bacterium]|nr:hypothetical protein [Planctomycetota bacterium]
MYDNRSGKNFLFSVWTYRRVEVQFQRMRRPPFDGELARKELAARLSTIEGVPLPETALRKRPTFNLGPIIQPGASDRFLDAFDWMLTEIKQAEQNED